MEDFYQESSHLQSDLSIAPGRHPAEILTSTSMEESRSNSPEDDTHFVIADNTSSTNAPRPFEDGLEVYQFDGLETHYKNGLEISNEDDKQTYNNNQKEVCADDEKEVVEHTNASGGPPTGSKHVRKRFVLTGIVLLLVLALVVGLGVGLSKKRSKPSNIIPTPALSSPSLSVNPLYSIGGAIHPDYYSKKGAWNGSGIAFAASHLKGVQPGLYTVFYQHHSGSIRYALQSIDGSSSGGSASEIVTTDAKNSTPISIVQYVMYAYLANATSIWHLFYIDKQHRVRQRSYSNITGVWQDGLINSLNLTALDADLVGLQACYYGGSGLRLPPNVTTSSPFGINVWFATQEDKFEQYAWIEGLKSWTSQGTFPGMNGRAGVGCYSWLPGTITYAMMIDTHSTLNLFWRDDDTNVRPTVDHPILSWTNATGGAIGNVYPSSSTGYTTYIYAQMADYTVRGFNLSFTAENSSIIDVVIVDDGKGPIKALPGSHLTVSSTEEGLFAFFQTKGDDITLFIKNSTRDTDVGNVWSSFSIEVD